MDGALFLVSVIGLFVIVAWSLANDRVPPGGRTTGILAMPDPNADPDPPDRRRMSHPPDKRRRVSATRPPRRQRGSSSTE